MLENSESQFVSSTGSVKKIAAIQSKVLCSRLHVKLDEPDTGSSIAAGFLQLRMHGETTQRILQKDLALS